MKAIRQRMTSISRDALSTSSTPLVNSKSTPLVGQSSLGSSSSAAGHDDDEWEKASVASAATKTSSSRRGAGGSGDQYASMSLNQFMQTHTSEDDASFAEIAAKDAAKHIGIWLMQIIKPIIQYHYYVSL